MEWGCRWKEDGKKQPKNEESSEIYLFSLSRGKIFTQEKWRSREKKL
jgi:hypothetical protein